MVGLGVGVTDSDDLSPWNVELQERAGSKIAESNIVAFIVLETCITLTFSLREFGHRGNCLRWSVTIKDGTQEATWKFSGRVK